MSDEILNYSFNTENKINDNLEIDLITDEYIKKTNSQVEDSSTNRETKELNNENKILYSPCNITCICEFLEHKKDWQKLSIWIKYINDCQINSILIPSSNQQLRQEIYYLYQSILRAKAFLFFHKQEYDKVEELIQNNNFDCKHHTILQKLWYDAHYAKTSMVRKRALCPVDKYRIRRKYPLPTSIWDGDETIYCFKQKSRRILMSYYENDRYPNPTDKKALSIQTKLSFTQVSNWFKNRRQRDRMQLKYKKEHYGQFSHFLSDTPQKIIEQKYDENVPNFPKYEKMYDNGMYNTFSNTEVKRNYNSYNKYLNPLYNINHNVTQPLNHLNPCVYSRATTPAAPITLFHQIYNHPNSDGLYSNSYETPNANLCNFERNQQTYIGKNPQNVIYNQPVLNQTCSPSRYVFNQNVCFIQSNYTHTSVIDSNSVNYNVLNHENLPFTTNSNHNFLE
ncbi:hypothetical protein A3Q56_06326 [Intoshia linei]|uniref:Homeobox domain-containing protein n=1 Tax=Intoshia linei TaxID=1819745 RepID=A0A177AX20_9BILA|nr:hypothetical protein A3Q56_06326 [Intoshia linei]